MIGGGSERFGVDSSDAAGCTDDAASDNNDDVVTLGSVLRGVVVVVAAKAAPQSLRAPPPPPPSSSSPLQSPSSSSSSPPSNNECENIATAASAAGGESENRGAGAGAAAGAGEDVVLCCRCCRVGAGCGCGSESRAGALYDPVGDLCQLTFTLSNTSVIVLIKLVERGDAVQHAKGVRTLMFYVPSCGGGVLPESNLALQHQSRSEIIARGLLQLNILLCGIGAFSLQAPPASTITYHYSITVNLCPSNNNSNTNNTAWFVVACARRVAETVNSLHPTMMKLLWSDEPLETILLPLSMKHASQQQHPTSSLSTRTSELGDLCITQRSIQHSRADKSPVPTDQSLHHSPQRIPEQPLSVGKAHHKFRTPATKKPYIALSTAAEMPSAASSVPPTSIVGKRVSSGGPTWIWGTQGCGSVGTVTHVDRPGWVSVRWNTGDMNLYRWGNGYNDLLLLDDTPSSTADGPSCYPLEYLRAPPLALIGKQVTPGPDWKWGERPPCGSVVSLAKTEGWIKVIWSNNTKSQYRWGACGAYDVVPISSGGEPIVTRLESPPTAASILAKRVRGNGPSWKWGEQGSRGAGYVVKLEDPGWVRILWDDGTSNVYRWGIRHFDLIVCEDEKKIALESALAFLCALHPRLGVNSPARYISHHLGSLVITRMMPKAYENEIPPAFEKWQHHVSCSVCGALQAPQPDGKTTTITGSRFRCCVCESFDICSSCVNKQKELLEIGLHKTQHPLVEVAPKPPLGSLRTHYDLLLTLMMPSGTQSGSLAEFCKLVPRIIATHPRVITHMDSLGKTLYDYSLALGSRIPDKTKAKLRPSTPLRSLLHDSVLSGDINSVKVALTQIQDINARDGNGYTALHYAIVTHDSKIYSYLVENNADCSIIKPNRHPDYEDWIRKSSMRCNAASQAQLQTPENPLANPYISNSIHITPSTFAHAQLILNPIETLVGKRVTRGPDWVWGAQGADTDGTVLEVSEEKGCVKVMWDNGECNLYRYNSRRLDVQVHNQH
ncbi:hypothetical protein Pelo_17287, partial [Pelomyxa schiedti]